MPVHESPIGPIEVLHEGAGPDHALLLHAAASGPRALYKLAANLAQAGWSTTLAALNGYGATHVHGADPADPFAAHARVAHWALEQMTRGPHGGRRVLFGHSMGGLIAVMAALEGLPVDALVVYEPIVLDCLNSNDPDDQAARAWDGACIETLHERFQAGDPETGVAAFVEAYNEVAWSALPAPLRTDLVAKAANLVAETRAAQSCRLDKTALAALPMPVLILQGSRSPPVTHRMTAGLARAIPHADRRIVEGAGHMGPVMSHAAVACEIMDFLRAATAR